jgi:hypothetical protein
MCLLIFRFQFHLYLNMKMATFLIDMSQCEESNAVIARNRILVHIDMIEMCLYICCIEKLRNDVLIHSAIH